MIIDDDNDGSHWTSCLPQLVWSSSGLSEIVGVTLFVEPNNPPNTIKLWWSSTDLKSIQQFQLLNRHKMGNFQIPFTYVEEKKRSYTLFYRPLLLSREEDGLISKVSINQSWLWHLDFTSNNFNKLASDKRFCPTCRNT